MPASTTIIPTQPPRFAVDIRTMTDTDEPDWYVLHIEVFEGESYHPERVSIHLHTEEQCEALLSALTLAIINHSTRDEGSDEDDLVATTESQDT